MNKKKALIICGIVIIILLGLWVIEIVSLNHESETNYESYGKEPVYSTNNIIEIEHSIYYINVGESITINIIETNGDKITWNSNNSNIASVDENGNVKGISEGRVYITISSESGEEASVLVVVVNPGKATKEETQKKDAINNKNSGSNNSGNTNPSRLEPDIVPTDDTPVVPPSQEEVSVESITLNKILVSGYVGGSETLKVTVNPSNATNQTVVWKSSDTSVVTVNNGVLTFLKEGTASVTASCGGKSASASVTVKPSNSGVAVTGITLNKSSVSGFVGDTYTLKATITPSNATNQTVVWKSSNSSIVSVLNGVLTFNSGGSAIITASCGGKSVSANITVKYRDRIHFISHKEASKNKDDHITGDAILLESNGYYAMIDMGHPERSDEVVSYLKNNGVKSLDFVLFTHMHRDHTANLMSVLKSGVKIKNIWMKNYDIPDYRTNYYPYPKYGLPDIGLNDKNTDEMAKSLARFMRILYISNDSDVEGSVSKIRYLDSEKEGKEYTFKNLKFTMTVYNNKINPNASVKKNDNYNSMVTLISINNHKVLLTGDDKDTKKFNTIAKKIGKVDILKVAHHGSVGDLSNKNYNGDIVINTSDGCYDSSDMALNSLKPTYYVITSSKQKIKNIKADKSDSWEYNYMGKDCVEKYNKKADIKYVDETSNALILDLSTSDIKFYYK